MKGPGEKLWKEHEELREECLAILGHATVFSTILVMF